MVAVHLGAFQELAALEHAHESGLVDEVIVAARKPPLPTRPPPTRSSVECGIEPPPWFPEPFPYRNGFAG